MERSCVAPLMFHLTPTASRRITCHNLTLFLYNILVFIRGITMSTPRRIRKIVLVGDSFVGKTHLKVASVSGMSPEDFIHGCYDSYTVYIEVEGKPLTLALWEVSSQEVYSRIRPLSYPHTHVFLACFSVNNPESFENVEHKWIPELAHFCCGVPLILVGCKTDLRDDPKVMDALNSRKQKPVSHEDGEMMAKRISAVGSLECSAKQMTGVDQVLRTVAKIANSSNSRTTCKGCVVV
ncbi:GTP-binding protein rhoA [Serendipita vermifera]|nr:GTP-binding protein rhoA [Serendipita vermifera]